MYKILENCIKLNMTKYFHGLVLISLLVFIVNNCVCPPVVPEASTEKPAGTGHESVNETLEHDPVSSYIFIHNHQKKNKMKQANFF